VTVKIFVMMPYRSEFEPVRAAIRRAAMLSGVQCVWSDETKKPGRISHQMTADIRSARVCIADVTGKNPNVLWEVGYAQALQKDVIVLSQSTADLFFDVQDQRAIPYVAAADQLERTLVQPLAAWLEGLVRTSEEVPPEDLAGTEGHEKASMVLGVERIAGSPYGFFDLLARTRRRIVLAAQNHFYLYEEERRTLVDQRVQEFLESHPERRVDIVLCDQTAGYAVKTWQYVTTERYKKDLQKTSRWFGELAARLNAQPAIAGRLRVRQLPFVPMSITFVDPEDASGFLVLTPNAYIAANQGRPSFIVSRARNANVFRPYWEAYNQRFYDSEPEGPADLEAPRVEPARESR
jgi:hypothetical protein